MRALRVFSLFAALTMCLGDVVKADNDVDDVEGVANATLVVGAKDTNVTSVYQCIGPSKEDLDLYEILAWWMDGVVQVSRVNLTTNKEFPIKINDFSPSMFGGVSKLIENWLMSVLL